MGCTGPCKQGRLPCPSPDACLRESDDAMDTLGRLVLCLIAFCLLTISAIAVLAWMKS